MARIFARHKYSQGKDEDTILTNFIWRQIVQGKTFLNKTFFRGVSAKAISPDLSVPHLLKMHVSQVFAQWVIFSTHVSQTDIVTLQLTPYISIHYVVPSRN